MTELTDSDRAAIKNAAYVNRSGEGVLADVYLAGKAAGIAEGLEMAAKACDQAAVEYDHDGRCDVSEQAMSIAAEACAATIRALKASA